jgi:hypothetical protein
MTTPLSKPAPPRQQLCPGCGAANGCVLAAGAAAQSCWCWESSRRLPLPEAEDTSCYCKTCLKQLAAPADE